jgi:hypothetical protein
MERRYRTRGIGPILLIGMLVVVSVGLVVAAVISPREPGVLLIVLFVGLTAYWTLFRAAFEIRPSDGQVSFRGFIRRSTVSLASVRRIQMRSNARLTVSWDGGSADLMVPIDGLHEFIRLAQEANSGVELKGV